MENEKNEKNELAANVFNNIAEKKRLDALKTEPKEDVDSEVKRLVQALHSQAIVSSVENSEEFQSKFIHQAKKSIDNELESLDQENIKRRQQTTYDSNAEACRNYGINADVPLWQIRLMRFGSGMWFVVYWIFATVTIAPISIFFKGIQSFIKSSWLVFIFALLSYLVIVVGIPLLIALLRALG